MKKGAWEFIKRNKAKIAVGVGTFAVGVLVGAATGAKKESLIPRKHLTDVDWLYDIAETFDEVSKGCDAYVPCSYNELANALSTDGIARDPSGAMLKVTNVLLFGNRIED